MQEVNKEPLGLLDASYGDRIQLKELIKLPDLDCGMIRTERREVMRENWVFRHQRINLCLTNRDWGFCLMAWLASVIPSQTAGYYFSCTRST